MKLFDEYDRTYMDFKDDDESHYAFLNRSALAKFVAARDILEAWFAAYPSDHQANLAANFTSDNYGPHFGAFFELYCYVLLRALSFEVHVEQVVDPKRGNPIDFVAGPLDNPSFCVESTVIADSELTVKSRRQLNILTERLNQIPSNRQLILDVDSTSEKPLQYGAVIASVEQWLQSLDVDTIPAADPDVDFDTYPSYKWSRDGWQLQFRVLRGERVDDLILLQGQEAWEGSMSRMKETLQKKATQHKGIQVPYIIAVDVISDEAIFRSPDSIKADLLGKEIVLYDRNADKVISVRYSPELARRSDREKGIWLGRSGPRNQHMSGVLNVNEVVPWSTMKQTPVLWRNPWADHPLPEAIWPGPQMILDQSAGTFRRQEGKTIAEIFGQG